MTDRFMNPADLDILAIEREARRLRAQILAQALRDLGAWLRARFGRPAPTRTA